MTPVEPCRACTEAATHVVYESVSGRVVTSLGEVRAGAGTVRLCPRCGHLQTVPLANLAEYYGQHYQISLGSQDEDQLYAVVQGRSVYRVQHQVERMLAISPPGAGAKVLDFGCAKGAAARELLLARPDLQLHLFDVSEMYRSFWERFVAVERCATHRVPESWRGRFDCVMSYFVLEHVENPAAVLASLVPLLAPGGRVHLVVPNAETNPADFIVADHVNHFSRASLERTLHRARLEPVLIDGQCHAGAWTVSARARDAAGAALATEPAQSPPPVLDAAHRLAELWSGLTKRVKKFEAEHAGTAAVYGAGVYGTFLASCLSRLDRLACFIDRSPFKQGRAVMGKPVLAPEALPADVSAVYVGLNPGRAREIIGAVDAWRGRPLDYFYVDA